MAENSNKPTLAILGGTGKEGPGLALRWANAGYEIIIGSRQAEKAQATAVDINTRLGIQRVRGMENSAAAHLADISILTVVFNAHQAILESIKTDLDGKILVDATARVDFRDPVPPPPPSAGRIAQQILGSNVRVVTAFQNVPAHALKKNLDGPLDIDVLVCSDDQQAADSVIELARNGGMRAFYAGNLDQAIVVEGLVALLININKHYQSKTATINIAGL